MADVQRTFRPSDSFVFFRSYSKPGIVCSHVVVCFVCYTPGIYAKGYIVFVFAFVRSYVYMYVCSFVLSFFRYVNENYVEILR